MQLESTQGQIFLSEVQWVYNISGYQIWMKTCLTERKVLLLYYRLIYLHLIMYSILFLTNNIFLENSLLFVSLRINIFHICSNMIMIICYNFKKIVCFLQFLVSQFFHVKITVASLLFIKILNLSVCK